MKKEIAMEITRAAFRTVNPEQDFETERERSWRKHNQMIERFRHSGSKWFFRKQVEVVFYSGMKAKTITSRMPAILKYLGDYKRAASFTDEDVSRVCGATDMIKNEAKISACVHNARIFLTLEKEYGSFRNYLLAFNQGFPTDTRRIPELSADLQRRFKFLGPRTSKHFLMVCGFPLVKPDRMVMRVLYRLGLILGETDEYIYKAVDVCLGLAEKAQVPPFFMDSILVGVGQSEGAGVCKKIRPECQACGLRPYCAYSTRNRQARRAKPLRHE
jgi:DNA-3-methyladenine glycosylase I